MKKQEKGKEEAKQSGPVFAKRIGNIKVSVFENASSESGRVYSNIAVVRRYRSNDGNWHDTHVLNGSADGLAAIESLRCAIDFINQREAAQLDNVAA
ncbi:MAG: hypothetical protein U0930_12320 [Pirellulales bacterium]